MSGNQFRCGQEGYNGKGACLTWVEPSALIGNIVTNSLELFSERFKIPTFHEVVQPSNQRYPHGPYFTALLYLSGKKLVLHGGSRDSQPVHLRTFSRTEYPPHPWVGGTRVRCCQNERCPVRSPWMPAEGPERRGIDKCSFCCHILHP